MKKITILAFLFWSVISAQGQLVMYGGSHIVVKGGAMVVISDITNNGGTIKNDGNLSVKGNLINNASGLFDNSSTGTFVFNGSTAQEITGDTDAGFYGTLEIDNSTGVALTATNTGSHQTVNGQLAFTNGLLTLNAFNLTIGATDPTGAGAAKYIKTNSTGGVVRSVPNNGSSVLYPVGNSAYNPLLLQNSAVATTDSYNVRVADQEPSSSVTSDMVDRSWEVTENTAGGSKLTVTPQWNVAEELTGFVRTNSAVGLTPDAGSTYNWKTYGAATGTYTRTGSTYYGVGTFAVADKDNVSDNTIVEDINLANPETDCYNAVAILTVAEDATVTVSSGATANFIAGQKVLFKPGFHADIGSSAHAYISSDFCSTLPPMVASPDDNTGGEGIADISELFTSDNIDVVVYPNPTRGNFTVAFRDKQKKAEIFLLNLQGNIVHQTTCKEQYSKKIDMGYLPGGMYIIVIKTGSEVITKKIVKNY